jgi:hypothetical protein
MMRILCQTLVVLVTLSSSIGSREQKEYSYSVRGRIVDSRGRPAPRALIFLDPLKGDDQVFGYAANPDGTFSIKDSTTVWRPIQRVYVTGTIPDNSVELLSPPFSLLPRLSDPVFAGLKIIVKENSEVNIGDVPIQVRYFRVVLQLQNRHHEPLLASSTQWQHVWLRLLDSRGRFIVSGNLSHVNIRKAVDIARSSVALALPDGSWRIQISATGEKGPWLRPAALIRVNKSTTIVWALRV